MDNILKEFIYEEPKTGQKIIKAIFCDISGCLVKAMETDNVLYEMLKSSGLPIFLTSMVPDGIALNGLKDECFEPPFLGILPSSRLKYLIGDAKAAIVLDNDESYCKSIYEIKPQWSDLYEKLSIAIDSVKQNVFDKKLAPDIWDKNRSYIQEIHDTNYHNFTGTSSNFGGKAEKLFYLANSAYSKKTGNEISFNIPDGFAISTHAFDIMYKDAEKEIRNILSKLNKDDINGIKIASLSIQKMMAHYQNSGLPSWLQMQILDSFRKIHDKTPPRFTIVRSSANVEDGGRYSYAGMFESIPNVTEKNLIESIFKVHRSLYSVPAIQYNLINEIRDFGKMGVLIQEQINSAASAIAFTSSDIPKYRQHYDIVIHDGFGEKLMSGKNQGNRFIIDKKTGKIIHKKIITPSSNHYEYLEGITETLRKLESLSDKPVFLDCEFALKKYGDKKILPYLVQCRPQTSSNTSYKRTKDEIIGKLRRGYDEIIRKGDILLVDKIRKEFLYKYDIASAIILCTPDNQIDDLSMSHAEIILKEIINKNHTPLIINPDKSSIKEINSSDWIRLNLKDLTISKYIPSQKTR